MTRLLTISDVMAQMNLSKKAVYALIRRRELEAVRVGKSYRIEPSAIARCLSLLKCQQQPERRVSRLPKRARQVMPTRGVELNVRGADYFVKQKQDGRR